MVSENSEPGLSQQFKDALAFLAEHEKELGRLKDCGVDNMWLDFGLEVGDKIQQSGYMPPELILALGQFRMGLTFSAIQIPRG